MKTLFIVLIIIVVLIVGGVYLIMTNKQQAGSGGQGSQESSGNENTGNQQTGASEPKTYNIEISSFAFKPAELRIKKGDTIIWTNKDSAKHTVTSDFGNELSSELLNQRQTYSKIFDTAGTFEYHCTPHPYMKGKVIVE